MDKVVSVIQVVLPIFVAVFLGVFSRKKALFTQEEIGAFQRFVVKFCFPCLLFQSCLTAELGPEAFSGLVLPAILLFTAAMIMIAGLIGCGAKEEEKAPAAPAPSAPTTSAPAAKDEGVEYDEIVISAASGFTEYVSAHQAWLL